MCSFYFFFDLQRRGVGLHSSRPTIVEMRYQGKQAGFSEHAVVYCREVVEKKKTSLSGIFKLFVQPE